jgi:hypothetical protein
MKLFTPILLTLIFAGFSSLAVAQSAPEQPTEANLPASPTFIKITVETEDGSDTLTLTPEGVESWNKFLHLIGRKGNFVAKFLDQIDATTEQLQLKPEFAPASVKAEFKKKADTEADIARLVKKGAEGVRESKKDKINR